LVLKQAENQFGKKATINLHFLEFLTPMQSKLILLQIRRTDTFLEKYMLKHFENLIPFPESMNELTIDLTQFSSPLFTHEEIAGLLTFFRHRNHTHYLIVKFLLSTGVSIPDLIYFQIKNIDFDREQIHFHERKRLGSRLIKLEKVFCRELYRYTLDLPKEAPLFEGRRGAFRDERSIQKILNTASLYLKKEINIPIIRDSLAKYLAEAGIPLREIQCFLGHRSLKSTKQRISSCERRQEGQMGHNFPIKKDKAA
jgi:integrase